MTLLELGEEGRGAGPVGTWTGTEDDDEGCAELVATGTTLSEVSVSQGVEEAGLDEAGAALEVVGMTGALLEEGASELVATGTRFSEVKVSQGVDEALG